MGDLATDTDGLNDAPCVVVLADKATDEDPEFLFFIAKSGDGPVARIRELCKLNGDTAPQLLLLDIPDNGGFYVGDGPELTVDGLRKWLSEYKGSKLERKQLG